MKKLTSIVLTVASVLFITALILSPVTGQSGSKNAGRNPISNDVMKIAVKTCEYCHAEPGNPMALMHLNLSNWDKYSPEKQAAKAKAMCEMVTKDKMPPKSYRKNHPDEVMTEKDDNKICDWALSIQIDKK
jgi:hypothetical protein